MNWNTELIDRHWLGGNSIAVSPDVVVDAFNCCESVLGREWMARAQRGAPGTSPTLHVTTVGQQLLSLRNVVNCERLVSRLRANDGSAFAELHAIHLMRGLAPIEVELEPHILVGDRVRRPDFRARLSHDPWTYVEVTAPRFAEAEKRIRTNAAMLTDLVFAIERSFALEVFLRREPTEDELRRLRDQIPQFCCAEGQGREELPENLGILIRNETQPGSVTTRDHQGEALFPRLGAARFATPPPRHICVRIPYADERAARVIENEAAQLPTDAAALVMACMSNAPGGLKAWGALIRRRFQPNLNTRVGAVVLFDSGQESTPEGEAVIDRVSVVSNPHARIPVPGWIIAGLAEYANGSPD